MECPSAEPAWVPLNHNPASNNIFEIQKPLPKWERFFIFLISNVFNYLYFMTGTTAMMKIKFIYINLLTLNIVARCRKYLYLQSARNYTNIEHLTSQQAAFSQIRLLQCISPYTTSKWILINNTKSHETFQVVKTIPAFIYEST